MNIIKMNNKKGGGKIMAMYWFVILMLIAGGIFAMVYTFYYHPYDVRELEAETMINHVADCLSNQGNLTSKLFNEQGFDQNFSIDFYENCHLNFEAESSFLDEPQYYLKVNFYKAEDLENSLFEISKGNLNLIASCNIQEEKEYEKEAKCLEDGFFSFNGEDLYLINILVVIKKTEKNVK